MLTLEDLELGWRRAMFYSGKRGFVTHPYLMAMVEMDRRGWLATIESEMKAGFHPSPASRCLVPKPDSMLRPGSILTAKDEVVYNALVQASYARIWEGLRWSQGNPDIAYQLIHPRRAGQQWVKPSAGAWREHREKSLALLKPDISHVVTTDITGCYENIDIVRLASDLRALGVATDVVNGLQGCLERWSLPRNKGIPQGYTASDILAKVYLGSVDQALRNQGYLHLRYVDDFRIFCTSLQAAKRAIRALTELMSDRGLNLQSAKTHIKPKAEAQAKFAGVAQTFDEVTADLSKQLRRIVVADPYVSTVALFQALKKRRGAPPELLERKFRESFSVTRATKFDKSLFHFLLGRLAAAGSRVAVGYCLETLRERPEETSYVLSYLSEVGLEPAEMEQVLAYMKSEDAIYDYQLYELIRWFYERGHVDPQVLSFCRTWAFDRNRDPWLRDYCVAYLGDHGDNSDLDRLEAQYAVVGTSLEKATYAFSLKRREIGRRNAFYARIKADGDLVLRAISMAKAWRPVSATPGAPVAARAARLRPQEADGRTQA